MKITRTIAFAIALLSSVSSVAAQTANTGALTPEASINKPSVNTVLPSPAAAAVQEARGTIKAIGQMLNQDTQNTQEKLRQETQEVRQGLVAGTEAIKTNLQNNLNAIRTNTALTSGEAKDAILKAREEAKTALQAQVESAKQIMLTSREEFKAQFEAKKEETKQKTELEKRGLQTILQSVQDEKKRQTVEKIAEQIQNVNGNYLDRTTVILSNLEEVLRNISSRADKAVLNGKDVTQVRADISEAENMIAVVRGYIIKQSGTTYPITIVDETNLGASVSDARNRLHTDLAFLRDEMKKVHAAVKKAATDLQQIPQVDDDVLAAE